jgi:hypothetical protein
MDKNNVTSDNLLKEIDKKIDSKIHILESKINLVKSYPNIVLTAITIIFVAMALIFGIGQFINYQSFNKFMTEAEKEKDELLSTVKKKPELKVYTTDREILEGQTINVIKTKDGNYQIRIIIVNHGEGSTGEVSIALYSKQPLAINKNEGTWLKGYDFEQVFLPGSKQYGDLNDGRLVLPSGLSYGLTYTFGNTLPTNPLSGIHPMAIRVYYTNGFIEQKFNVKWP